MIPKWLDTEEKVKRFFQLLGFKTETCSIHGRQIDIVAQKIGTFQFQEENWVIEVTIEKVGEPKGSSDYQKLMLINKERFNDRAKMMMVTTNRFTADQKATLERLNVYPITLSELESGIAGLDKYAYYALHKLEKVEKSDIGYDGSSYIPLNLKISNTKDNKSEVVHSSKWMSDILDVGTMGVCALLGNLGSGKTSTLQKVLEDGCTRYLQGDAEVALPIFVPLGKYKQHSGELMQMIMTEFRNAGIESFPVSFIEHYIKTGRLVLLLDGLDEVHPINNTEDIFDTVKTLLSLFTANGKAVISCRRHFFDSNEAEHSYFGNYTFLENAEKIQQGIKRIFERVPTTYIAYLESFSEDNVYDYFLKKCELSKAQCDKIFGQYYGFKEMSRTPVLLAMIAATIIDKTLDIQKASNYPILDLYKAYVYRWISRDKERSKLTVDVRKRFSTNIAVRFMRDPITSCDWNKIADILKSDPEWQKITISYEEALLEIRNGGFLIREDDGLFRFVHRSIMEFLCAESDFESFEYGEKPSGSPTDGYKLFINLLIARSLDEAKPIWPSNCWYENRGTELLQIQSQLILDGLLEEKDHPTIMDIPNLIVSRSYNFKSSRIVDCTLYIEKEDVKFTNCYFGGSTLVSNHKIHVDRCEFSNSKIKLDDFSKIPPVEMGSKIDNSLEFPENCYRAAFLLEKGCTVFINQNIWALTLNDLERLNAAIGGIKGKAQIQNVTKGQDRSFLLRLYNKLRGADLVEIDESRQYHQIQLTKKMQQTLEQFRRDPIQNHHKIKDILVMFDQV